MNLDRSKAVNDAHLAIISTFCTNLRELDLSGTQITDDGVNTCAFNVRNFNSFLYKLQSRIAN